jgi:hypothetical protein
MTKLEKLKADADAAADAYTAAYDLYTAAYDAAEWVAYRDRIGTVADVAWDTYDAAYNAWLAEFKKRKESET